MAAVSPAQPEPRITVSRTMSAMISMCCNLCIFDSNHAETTPRRHAAAGKEQAMADLVLVYGMRLLPADEVKQVGSAPVALHNGNEAQVTMHVLEGSREQIENQ